MPAQGLQVTYEAFVHGNRQQVKLIYISILCLTHVVHGLRAALLIHDRPE